MPCSSDIDADRIAALQRRLTADWHGVEPSATGMAGAFERLVAENHLRNFKLWHEEDIARRDDLGPERVHRAKRAIDLYNQERNNFIEEMDKLLVAELQPEANAGPGCPRNSETPGMIIDRLSILALKEYHMREETMRADARTAHKESCELKLARIVRQRSDLKQCLNELLADIIARRRTFAVYYQFKMYNDPELNPQLREQSG